MKETEFVKLDTESIDSKVEWKTKRFHGSDSKYDYGIQLSVTLGDKTILANLKQENLELLLLAVTPKRKN